MADNLEAGPHILQQLGRVLAQLAQPASAIRTGIMVRPVGVDLARKMLRKRTAERLRSNRSISRGSRACFFDGVRGLEFFKLKFQLFDLAEDLLAPGSEEHALKLLDQQLQPFHLGCA